MNSKKDHLKTIFTFILSVFLVVQGIIISPQSVYAATSRDGLYEYTFANNVATITKYKGPQNATIDIPEKIDGAISVTSIGENAFIDATWMKNLTLPNTLRNIGISAFENTGITEITIPGSVTNISTMAFYGCQSLKTIYILHGVQTIGDAAFADCINLDTIAMPRSVRDMSKRSLQGNTMEIQADADTYVRTKYSPQGATVTNSDLPKDSPIPYEYGIASDGSVTIKSYQGLNVNPEIPDEINGKAVKHISPDAFNNNYGHNIESIKLPASLLTIGSNAFAGTKLKSAIIPDSVTGIGEGAFDDKKDLILYGSCNALDQYLANMHNIVFVAYGAGATLYRKLTAVAVNGYGSINGVRTGEYKKDTIIPIEAVPRPGYSFLSWATSGAGVFGDINKRITTFTMPDANTSINATFDKLNIYIEFGIVKAYDSTQHLDIPEQYEYQKFIDNRMVPTTRISDITGNYYNHYNGGPVSVFIPKTVTTIDDGVFYTQCGNLTDISVDPNNPNYSSEDGVLFDKNKTRLIRYPSQKAGTTYTIPDTVVTIDPYAFYNCNNLTTINIPNGQGKLTTIGNRAFSYCNSLTTMSIPEGVKDIGNSAFLDCDSLTTISIPASVTSIGSQVFYSCDRLTQINVDSTNLNYTDNNEGILYNKDKSTIIVHPIAKSSSSYVMPSSVIRVEEYAFSNCTILTSVDMSNATNLSTIGGSAFSSCTALTSINLPDSVKTIGGSAFSSCTALTSINIKAGVTSIGSQALYNCTSLNSITVDTNNANYYSDGVGLYNKQQTSFIVHAIASQETEYTILPTVTAIQSYAFSGCKNLNKIELPSGLVSIGSYAFYNCNNLATLSSDTTKPRVLPDTVTTIDSYAFLNCTALTDIDIKENISSIDYYAFSGCTNLKEVIIRRRKNQSLYMSHSIFNGVPTVNLTIKGYMGSSSEKYAFNNNIKFVPLDEFSEGLVINNGVLVGYIGTDVNVILSDNIHTIGSKAFSKGAIVTESNGGKDKLIESITMPLSVKKFEDYAFDGCEKLIKIDVPVSVNNISKSAFKGCKNLEEIAVDSGNATYASISGVLTNKDKTILKEVPDAFKGPNKDGKYTIPSTINSIESSAFADCTGLTDITISHIGHIGVNAFKGAFTQATNNINITLTNVDDIDNGAFADCTSIKKIVIPSTVTRIGDGVFEGCTNLTDIDVASGNLIFASENGVLFTNPNTPYKKQLIKYPMGKELTSYSIPVGTLAIYKNAFKDCTKLTEVIIPNDVATIGANAFDGCTFVNITIPAGVSTIDEQAFANNRTLTEIILPNTVSTVKQGAFINCDKLTVAKIYRTDIKLEGIVFDEKLTDMGTPQVTIHAFPNSNGYLYTTTHSNIGFAPLTLSLASPVKGVVGENVTIDITPDSNDYAKAIVSDTQISRAMDNAVAGLKDTINITSQTVSNIVYSIDTVITKNSITLLADDTEINNLTVNNPIAKIKFDKNALSSIKSQATGSNIVISTEIIDINTLPEDIKNQINGNSAFKLNISDGVNNISNFGSGKLSISLPYTLSNSENINLYYMDNVGELIQIVSTYINNMVTFDISNLQDIYIIK